MQKKKTPIGTICIYPEDDPRVFEMCCFNKQKTVVLTVVIYTVILPHSRIHLKIEGKDFFMAHVHSHKLVSSITQTLT